MPRRITCTLNDLERMELISTALSNKIRLKMFKMLYTKSYSINELAFATNTPMSNTSFHLQILKKAGLVNIVSNPTKKGNEKVVSQMVDNIIYDFSAPSFKKEKVVSFNIPLGSFADAKVIAPCGMASDIEVLDIDDEPSAFFSTRKYLAQLVWFTNGYIEYKIPNYSFRNEKLISLSFSLELCSECPNYREDWKSHVTFWINDREVCTYLSPGDFGSHRGKFNPSYWSNSATQYGLLKRFKVTNDATFIDEISDNGTKIRHLNLHEKDYFTFRIGFKEDSKYIGGVNIFGKKFGDHPQNILFEITHE